MSKINFKLEPVDEPKSKEMFEKAGLKDVELYRWQRHAVNEILQITKYLIPETNQVMLSVFAESGAYIPSHEELMAIKGHFLPAKIVSIKCEYGMSGEDTFIVPINVEILEWVQKPQQKKPLIDTFGKGKLFGLDGKELKVS